MINKDLISNRQKKEKQNVADANVIEMNEKVKAEKAAIAEYYESRRRFLIKVAEARKKLSEPEKKTNPLTLSQVEEY